jgi:hypothetical protein
MKKLLTILLLLVASVLCAAEEETVGDASGNDLSPVVKGLSATMSGGIVSIVGGEAGKYVDPIGTAINLAFGYDWQIVPAFTLGFDAKFGILQINTDSSKSVSPWLEDFAPVLVGLDISPTYCINNRWEIGANISFDVMLMAKAKDSAQKESSMFIAVGGGVDAEYYTYARHFSLGMSAEFNYIVNFDGFAVTVMPYLKYSFDI